LDVTKLVDALFSIYKDAGGNFRFRLRAPNNEIIAVSEGYQSRSGCINGIGTVKRYCNADIEDQTRHDSTISNPKFQVYRDAADKYRFRLRALNNEIILTGEAYETKQGCLNGIQAIKRYCGARIQDSETGKFIELDSAAIGDSMQYSMEDRRLS
jgi:uncharacterized protein YegP (UPF0339 family)